MTLLRLFKAIGGPGSIGFLAVGSAIGLIITRLPRRSGVIGRIWLLGLYVIYIILGLPVVARTIAAPFDSYRAERAVPSTLDALFVLDGDNRRGRLEETLRVWAIAHPRLVVVSGEAWLQDRMVERGVPREHVVRDDNSATTLEQMEYVKRYVTAHPSERIGLVASRLQMPRIVALARQIGLAAAFYPASVDREPAVSGASLYLPTYTALRVSRDALYERAAFAYYEWRGWIPGESSMAAARMW